MKRLWASGILLVFLLGLCGLGYWTAETSSQKLLRQLNLLQSEIYQGNLSTALAVSQGIQHQWEEEHKKLCTFMPHDDLTALGETLSELPALIESEELGLLKSRCSLASMQISQLSEGEVITLDNLL